jgi:outer membrane protein assembly factor BamB
MPSPGSRRWLRRGLVAVPVLLLALAGAAAAFILLHAPRNVSHPNVEFTATTVAQATPSPPAHRRVVTNNFQWPWYGYDLGRTRFFADGSRLDPPLHQGWSYDDGGLLEFPPVIYSNTMYFVDDNGWVKAVGTLSGHVLWQHQVGTLAAASPAIDVKDGLVMVPLLSDSPTAPKASTPGNGRFVAVTMNTGRVVWSRSIPAGTESSPLVWHGTVYFGDQSGNVYAVRARDGHVYWTFHAQGAVKGGLSLAGGLLYFGDYAGSVYAVNANTGQNVWSVGTSGAQFGFGSGQFYSTPAVAFGRVYIGNTDGRVYSFAARTGQLAWATGTGAYVYASPAVEDTPGLGPTVYIGSYDGNFYALNAQSGAIRWTHNAGGKISGSATIVGDVVYYSDLGTRTSAGLDVRTGRQLFSFPDGLFNPVVADDRAIYMIGRQTIYQMLPGKPPPEHPASRHPPRPRIAGSGGGASARSSRPELDAGGQSIPAPFRSYLSP